MPENTNIDLGFVKEVVRDVLTGVDVAQTLSQKRQSANEVKARRSHEAELHRSLLNLADTLTLSASLVRNEYWRSRGEVSYEL